MDKLIVPINFLLFISLMLLAVFVIGDLTDSIRHSSLDILFPLSISILGIVFLFYIILGLKQMVAYNRYVLSLKIKGGVFGVNPVLKTILDSENAVIMYEVPTKVRVEGIHNDEDGRLIYAFTVRCYVNGKIRVRYYNKRGSSWIERKRWKFQNTQTESSILAELEPILTALRKA